MLPLLLTERSARAIDLPQNTEPYSGTSIQSPEARHLSKTIVGET